MTNISAYRADYLPLIGQLMNQMRLPQIINESMAIPKSQAIVDAGTMISGMILNLLHWSSVKECDHFHQYRFMNNF